MSQQRGSGRKAAGRILMISGLAALATGWAAVAQPAARESGGMPNFDALRSELAALPLPPLPSFPAGLQPAQVDRRMGLPTFLWARGDEAVAVVGPLNAKTLIEARGREYLRQNAAALKLSEQQIADARLSEAQFNAQGISVARYNQRINGVEVFNRSLNVMMNGGGKLVAISGYFADASGVDSATYAQTWTRAIAAAVGGLGGSILPASLIPAGSRGGYRYFNAGLGDLVRGFGFARPPRIKQIWYPSAAGLEPAYYVELSLRSPAPGNHLDYSFVISGVDRAILFRKDLKAYDTAYSYRTFADASGAKQPFDSPLGNGYAPFSGSSYTDAIPRIGAPTNLVTLAHGPIATGDPWLPDGAETTTGNNVDAYLDSGLILDNPLTSIITDGYYEGSGDLRTSLTGPNTFDYAIAADDDPAGDAARNGAIVNLFYINNWLHDSWYDHGFNEAAANGQSSNYGRGGEEGDPILAEGQDASGRNNANMYTPSDGSSPIMQMYLFDGPLRGDTRVTAPAEGEPLSFTGASFGPQTFDVSGTLGLAADVVDAPTDGCGPLLPDPTGLLPTLPPPPQLTLLGKIAMIDRGSCSFTTKAQFAIASGATAMVVVNNAEGDPITMGNADIPIALPGLSTDQLYTIPSIMVSKSDGAAIKAQLAAGETVQMHVQRNPSIDYDGTLDELVIAHEYFHHVSNRLVGNGSGLDNNQGGSMGEGWSDVAALMLAARAEDVQVPGNEQWQGSYSAGFYVIPSYYFGIRRAPYSTDFAKNPLTFKHIENGVALPDTAPLAFGLDGASNAEVHNAGEVWANMVWECYSGLLNDSRHSFAEAQGRMQDYIIAGLKMTPNSPTFTEARDGILAAALATDFQDYAECSQGFARRGIGQEAVSPDRDSSDHAGVVESYANWVDNVAPKARLIPDYTTRVVGKPVKFNASGSLDSDGSIVSYTFDFGDGTAPVTQASSIVSHSYIYPGSYEAKVTVTDNLGFAGVARKTILALNNAPIAKVKGLTKGSAPIAITFNGEGSSDPDAGDAVVKYRYDFGDGSAPVIQSTPRVRHTYSVPGTFTLSLRVYDKSGRSSQPATLSVKINPPG